MRPWFSATEYMAERKCQKRSGIRFNGAVAKMPWRIVVPGARRRRASRGFSEAVAQYHGELLRLSEIERRVIWLQ